MSRRPPAPPPELPGFEYLELLGSGGFADVFLYEQQLPKRRVAVKVLLPDRLESAGQQFASEANTMAMLSTHPAIVTILQAGMSADHRPYIVMEHCPRPNLQVRYRRAPFSVAETLHTAIPVIAAVETAHRMDVLHRDIKPANILVTEYNRPALTDFGIAAHADSAEAAAGMSIPWSPPESFANPPRGGRETDVYQLGATVYTLLAGRAPFELPGQRNSSAELIDRAERMALPRIGRPDVPASLEAALAKAMAKRPEDRYRSAVAFARALQKVQIELEHSVTPIDILDDSPADGIDDDEDGLTRVRNITSIDPVDDGTRPSAATEAVPSAVDESPTVLRGPGAVAPQPGRREPAPMVGAAPAAWSPSSGYRPEFAPAPAGSSGVSDATLPPDALPAPASGGTAEGARRWPWFVGGGIVVAALAVGAAFGLPALLGDQEPDDPGPTSEPKDPIAETPPAVGDLEARAHGDEVTFSWSNPDPQEGDTYQWGIDVPGGQISFADTRETSVTVDARHPTCIEVYLVRADGVASPAATTCAD
ncbi:serine/threonine-protein kinase [Microbacterium halophytorum]|uniref:serine/threonine-protein kinase n=1 Tax=Microbacterium halophytorum TaxID=2067568 RepID=UPI000CFC1482|nr:serine/threonine-protein kinase [Microbacterium halophytorum]